MTKPQVTVVVLLLAACGNSWARDKTVTIIYDVDLREFVCWYEGERIPPTKDPSTRCDPARPQNHATNAHKYAPGLYFFRGQTVRVQLQNARLIDVFTADLQVGDLAIPSIAIFGGLTELPSLKPLGAAEKVVSAAGVTLATAAPARSPGDDLDQGLDQWTKDELNAYLKENLHDIAGGEKLLAALSWRPESTIGSLQSLLEKDKPLIVQALSVRTDLDQVQPLLDNLRKIYCAPAAPITNTDDVQNYLSAVRLLTRAIERQQSLKDQIGITELATLSKTLTDQFTAAGDDEEIRHALEYSVDSLKDFRTRFENAFPPAQRRARIRAIKLDQKKYTLDAVAAEFLDHLNNQGDKDDASLKRLQDNLNVLSDQWQKVSAEIDRLDTLRGNVDKVTQYFSAKSEPEDKRDVWKFWELQQVLEGIGLRAISAAEAGNCVAASMTLPEAISAPVVNQWYGSKEITLTLKRGTRVPLFDLAGVTEASRANVKEQPAAPAASSGPGTHGCLVRRRTDGRQFLLTAGHVVSSTPGNVPPQRIVFQPKASSPNPALIVGPTVLGFIGNHVGAGGHMDAVLYDLNNPQRSATNESFTHLPAPTGILSVAATVQQRPAVLKVGAVTGQTLALFSTFHQRFDDPTTAQTFFNVMEFGLDPQNPPPNGRVADRGDSGALVISRSAGSTGLIVGLLFAVSMDFTRFLVVPFERIASFLQVDL
jgi:hypothetical protein